MQLLLLVPPELTLSCGVKSPPAQSCKPSRPDGGVSPLGLTAPKPSFVPNRMLPFLTQDQILSPGPRGSAAWAPSVPKFFEERASSEIKSGVLVNCFPQKKNQSPDLSGLPISVV